MRVIAGMYKGRTLTTKNDLSVRPATDRVKQAIFDMLMNRIQFDEAKVLDLFAGSGSLGIEALSRGAAHATFVEEDDDAAQFLEKNIHTLGCERSSALITMDATAYLNRCNESFDLIFADPPYAFDETASLPSLIVGKGALAPNGYLLIEHTKDLQFEDSELYAVGPTKQFGRTRVTFFQKKTESS